MTSTYLISRRTYRQATIAGRNMQDDNGDPDRRLLYPWRGAPGCVLANVFCSAEVPPVEL